MQGFEKARADHFLPYREGPVHVKIGKWQSLTSLTILLIGSIAHGLGQKYSNSNRFVEEQNCPILEGRFHNWLLIFSSLLIAFGFLGFSISGILPKILLGIQLRNEAICCGKILMSKFGKFLFVISALGLTLLNINGTLILSEAIKQDMQSEEHWSKDETKTYCHKVIVALFQTLNFGFYASWGLVIALLIFFFVKSKKCSFQDLGEKEDIDWDAEEREFLDVVGFFDFVKEKEGEKKALMKKEKHSKHDKKGRYDHHHHKEPKKHSRRARGEKKRKNPKKRVSKRHQKHRNVAPDRHDRHRKRNHAASKRNKRH